MCAAAGNNDETCPQAGLTIGITGIRLRARVGVTMQERVSERDLLVDVLLVPAATEGLASDDLGGTVDYAQAVRIAADVVAKGEYRLIEHMGALIADRLLAELRVLEVSVSVRKPAPPADVPVADAWARVTRRA